MKCLKKILITALLFFSTTIVASTYNPRCYVENGDAVALICTDSAASGTGIGSIDVYDIDGELIKTEINIIWVGVVVNGCKEVKRITVSEEAVWCTFNP